MTGDARRISAGPAVLTFALCAGWVAMIVQARDGDVMAPGAARVVAYDADGALRVGILEREYAGRWERVTLNRLERLPQHWRGSRGELRASTLARAELAGPDAAVLVCEFALVEGRPAGICEDSSRVYYLQR